MKLNAFLISGLFVLLSGCATITGVGKDNTPDPSPLVNFKSQINPQKTWSHNAGQFATLNRDVLFVTNTEGTISALNTQNGKTLWKTDLNQTLTTAPGVGNGFVLVGGSKGELFALNQSNGKIVWHSMLSNAITATPVIVQDKAIIKTLDGQLYALDGSNGKVIWKYNHGAPLMILAGGSKPLVLGNKVVTGYADGKLEAYSLDKGRLIWETQVAQPKGASDVEQMIDIVANQDISGNTIYVVTYQGNLAAINATTGQFLWQQPLSSYTGLTLSDQIVYVTDANGIVSSFNRYNGEVVFQQNNLKYRQLTAPVMMNNTIVVGDGEGYLHFLNPSDGQTIGRVGVDKNDPIVSAPIVDGNSIYIVTIEGVAQRWN